MASPDVKKKIQFNGDIVISYGRSRKDTNWHNELTRWSEIIKRLSDPTRTPETIEEYFKLGKTEQGIIKDVGGFVGGSLKSGRRKADAVANRQLITLDADSATNDLIDNARQLLGCGFAWYSTHSHRPEKPRLRLLIPLKRPVLPDEYQAVSRYMANILGLDLFDDTTYEPHRLMYWPSVAKNGVYNWGYEDDEWLDPDYILGQYEDWRDQSFWPESSKTKTERHAQAEKQGDPLAKPGAIGLFCRTYGIEEAIAKYLPEVYATTSMPDRYSYKSGSSVCGLVLYENGKFAYSHHGTDPISGRLVNAFDLVRIHLYGARDEDEAQDTPVTKLPSYKAMSDLVSKDDEVKLTMGHESMLLAKEEFGDLDTEVDVSWMKKLAMNQNGKYLTTINNACIVLEHDPALKESIAYNEFSHRPVILKDIPWHKVVNTADGDAWSDEDDSSLRHYMEHRYGIVSTPKINDAVMGVTQKNKTHPVRDYLTGLAWDGIQRVDKLFIDYLGAEDCEYIKAVTRKMLAGAAARILRPGIKFDYMLILVGPQGTYKSSIIDKLGGRWYSDSLYTVTGKDAFELLQGVWLIEMGEMAATKKAEIESIKQFISKREDIFRVAYGRRTGVFPRQCVFFGTTNDYECLRDRTGNRRFWPVDVRIIKPIKDVWKDLSKDEIDQVWAEAVQIYKAGEALYLPPHLEKEAYIRQEAHTEESSKFGMISEYLDKLIPENWETLDIDARRQFIQGSEDLRVLPEGTMKRNRVCALEVWVELYWGDPKQFKMLDAREINDILRRLPGWKAYTGGAGHLKFGKTYGLQRAFVRE
jgi:predicted P-loop ATPase